MMMYSREISFKMLLLILFAALLISCIGELFKDVEVTGGASGESSGVLTGSVMDKDSLPVVGVVARLVILDIEAVTGNDGVFSLNVDSAQRGAGLQKKVFNAMDTLVLSYQGQPFYAVPLLSLTGNLGIMIMASKEVKGNINSLGVGGVASLYADFNPAGPDITLHVNIKLQFNPQTGEYAGRVYFPYISESQAFNLNITGYDAGGQVVLSNYLLTFTLSTAPVPILSGPCRDPLNSCKRECAHLRTIDYATQIAPIWEANACVKGCHTRGSQGFTNTGNLRKIKVIQNGKDTSVYRGISFQPELNVLSMLINVPDWSDSTKHPIWRVRPFAPDSSYLLYLLSNPGKKPGEVRMPNNLPEVPDESKKLIEQWILEGACPSP